MDGGQRASRRGMLRLGALAIGGLAGAIGLGAALERAQGVARPLGGSLKGAVSLELRGIDWSMRSPQLRPGELPRRGDSVTLSGALARAAGGGPIGTFFGTSAHLDTPGHGSFAQTQMQFHSFALPSSLPETINLPSALKASALTISVWPGSVSVARPLANSNSCTFSLPTATTCASGLKASVWLQAGRSMTRNSRAAPLAGTSHTRNL